MFLQVCFSFLSSLSVSSFHSFISIYLSLTHTHTHRNQHTHITSSAPAPINQTFITSDPRSRQASTFGVVPTRYIHTRITHTSKLCVIRYIQCSPSWHAQPEKGSFRQCLKNRLHSYAWVNTVPAGQIRLDTIATR